MGAVKKKVKDRMNPPKTKNVERLEAYYKKLKQEGEIRGNFDG
jgi:hypothetical protein